jgi:hypothetical protein
MSVVTPPTTPNNRYATRLLISSNGESNDNDLCLVIIVITCVTVSAYLTFRLYRHWVRLSKFLALRTGVAQATVFRVRELILFSLKYTFFETWNNPEGFYLRWHEVWIFVG